MTIERAEPLSRHEAQLLDGYCGQAALVLEHLALATTVAGRSGPGGLEHLTPRELEVLGLMARGLTNAAICDDRGRRRWHWIVAATVLATVMSWSRTYLSVHWATDTIGGSAIGIGCALLAEAAWEGGRRRIASADQMSTDRNAELTRVAASERSTDPA
ncbi:MAG: phosphatase PAP2 family protein [Acidimicrobiales bacterium]